MKLYLRFWNASFSRLFFCGLIHKSTIIFRKIGSSSSLFVFGERNKWAVGNISRLTKEDLFLIDSQEVYLEILRQTGFVSKIRNKYQLYFYQTRLVSNF